MQFIDLEGMLESFQGTECPVIGSGRGDKAVHTAGHSGGSTLKACVFHSIPIIPQFKGYRPALNAYIKATPISA